MTIIISDLTLKSKLKSNIRKHLHGLGFRINNGELVPPVTTSKDAIRNMYSQKRFEIHNRESTKLSRLIKKHLDCFASGNEIIPEKISPYIEIVSGDTRSSELFQLASRTWSIPVSPGFGRRIRGLIWDGSNEKIMGIFAIGDPVFNLRDRDKYIDWSADIREARLVGIMDAYVLGAIPPYNKLLCGKMIATLLRSRNIISIYNAKYNDHYGTISHQKKNISLAMITTSSALGRSSVYNRVTLDSIQYLKKIGSTSGFGHFHFPDSVFSDMRELLLRENHPYASGFNFGEGPNWKFRVIRQALSTLGFNPELIKHGISRELYACQLSDNANAYLRGEESHANYSSLLSIDEIATKAKARWVIPRSIRDVSYKFWNNTELIDFIETNNSNEINLSTNKTSDRSS